MSWWRVQHHLRSHQWLLLCLLFNSLFIDRWALQLRSWKKISFIIQNILLKLEGFNIFIVKDPMVIKWGAELILAPIIVTKDWYYSHLHLTVYLRGIWRLTLNSYSITSFVSAGPIKTPWYSRGYKSKSLALPLNIK